MVAMEPIFPWTIMTCSGEMTTGRPA
uniref:Uncharacterized protein n=1 Tax=Anguilla anguilla TaxID=7936 RepID=A0A0E9QWT5_ANGAN